MNYLFIVGKKKVNEEIQDSILIMCLERQKFWTEYSENGKTYTLEEMINSIDIKFSDTIYVYNISNTVRDKLRKLHYDFRLIDNNMNW